MTVPTIPTTHAHDDALVVFTIGMTIRRLHRPDLWGPVVTAMPRMLSELHRNKAAAARGEEPDLGFLGAENLVGRRGPYMVQFWRSIDHLYDYASMQNREHVPAWRAFNVAARKNPGAVGIWHETYAVPADGIETFYGPGASVSLGAAIGVVPAGRRGRNARERLASSSRLDA